MWLKVQIINLQKLLNIIWLKNYFRVGKYNWGKKFIMAQKIFEGLNILHIKTGAYAEAFIQQKKNRQVEFQLDSNIYMFKKTDSGWLTSNF